MMRTSFLAVLLVLAAACGTPERDPVLGRAQDFLPMAEGTRWAYDVHEGERRLRLDTHQTGGDVRHPHGERVRYDFVYGRPPDEEHDITKSIYAMWPSGARLFYFDAYVWDAHFDPPVVLLPEEVRVGRTWTWEGTFATGNHEEPSAAVLRVEAVESVTVPAGTYEAVRVSQVHERPRLRIDRWFAKGVGLVREEQVLAGADGEAPRRGVRLVRFEAGE